MRCQNKSRQGKTVRRAKAGAGQAQVGGDRIAAGAATIGGTTGVAIAATEATADAPKGRPRSSWKN